MYAESLSYDALESYEVILAWVLFLILFGLLVTGEGKCSFRKLFKKLVLVIDDLALLTTEEDDGTNGLAFILDFTLFTYLDIGFFFFGFKSSSGVEGYSSSSSDSESI